MITPKHHSLFTRIFIAFVLAMALSTTFSGYAQAPAPGIAELDVDLWPDYDQPSVLVLMTGQLPADAALPATVTVPIPEAATLNAVARIEGNELITIPDSDIDDMTPGRLTLTTPDQGFRVEYYMPYQVDDENHGFTFEWLSGVPVESLFVSIQQPAVAQEMTVLPAPGDVVTGADTLRYHNLQAGAVPAGETFSVKVDYRMVDVRLTREVLSDFQPLSGPEPAPVSDETFNWTVLLAVMGGVLVVAAIGWFIFSQRQSQRVTKPRPVRRTPPGSANATRQRPTTGRTRYCHECGQPVDPADKFCRNCGTPIKG